jgi:hypothetical protein
LYDYRPYSEEIEPSYVTPRLQRYDLPDNEPF